MHNSTRRSFLRNTGITLGSALFASSLSAKTERIVVRIPARGSTAVDGDGKPVSSAANIQFHNVNTGETMLCPMCVDGSDIAATQKRLNYIFRDWRTGEQIKVDMGLLTQMGRIQQTLGINKPVNLISGYRSPKTNHMLRQRSKGVAKKSFHMVGQAMDFNIPGVSLAQIRQAALDLKAGGVGYYPASGFVHIDTGPVRRWG